MAHDEILFDVAADAAAAAADETRAAAAAVVKEIASAREVSVPLAVEVRMTTRSWADLEVETAAAAAPAPPRRRALGSRRLLRLK